MSAPETVSLALWAVNLARTLTGLDAWTARIDARMAEAAAAGAKLLVMPEYAAEQWLAFKPEGLTTDREIPWLAELAPDALARLAPLPAKHGIGLLAGTMPWTIDGGQRNRAWLLLPDGRAIHQDKLCLTPDEQDPKTWLLTPGDSVQMVEWDGLRIVTLVCLDVEMPALSSLLAPHRPDLLLVPSMTLRRSGSARVFSCAKARAVELMCAVALTGVVGASPGTTWNPTNVSGNAVFLPCERSLGHTGVHSETPAVDEHWGDGPFLLAADIPVGAMRALRDRGSEVWPGAWSADHVRVVTGHGSGPGPYVHR